MIITEMRITEITANIDYEELIIDINKIINKESPTNITVSLNSILMYYYLERGILREESSKIIETISNTLISLDDKINKWNKENIGTQDKWTNDKTHIMKMINQL